MVALVSFIRYMPPDTELSREMDPQNEKADWYDTLKTNIILADIYDAFVSAHTKKGTKPKTYPRPVERRTIGKGAIPLGDFWSWWNKER